ncbi:unnamed protein product [Meloidogyne enterolobii]|uniref:Uncharacterized protein n=2 Tax=Meloidogyne enterolobii TaxID=390850 RepID=A0A6V7VSA3_MELEN|nr:unnamed protein product [Meloidogyne enterolobii]
MVVVVCSTQRCAQQEDGSLAEWEQGQMQLQPGGRQHGGAVGGPATCGGVKWRPVLGLMTC